MEKKYLAGGLLAAGIAFSLAGCGGGGGDGGGTASGADYAAAGGNTEPAKLDSSNTVTLTGSVVNEVDSIALMGSQTPKPSGKTLTGAATSNTDKDGCGGTRTESSGSTSFSKVWSDWHEDTFIDGTPCADSRVHNGETSMSSNGVDAASATVDSPAVWSFSSWGKTTYPDDTWRAGDFSFELTEPNSYDGASFVASMEESDSEGTYGAKVDNLTIKLDVDGNLKFISGTFYDFTEGYIKLDTPTVFTYSSCTDGFGNQLPVTGVMTITGDTTWKLDAGQGNCGDYAIVDPSGNTTMHTW